MEDTLLCFNCNVEVCNDCWDIGQEDRHGTHYLCPICRVRILFEPTNYLDEQEAEAMK